MRSHGGIESGQRTEECIDVLRVFHQQLLGLLARCGVFPITITIDEYGIGSTLKARFMFR